MLKMYYEQYGEIVVDHKWIQFEVYDKSAW